MIALTVSFHKLHRIILEAITGDTPEDILEPAYQADSFSRSNPTMHTFIFKDQESTDFFISKAKKRPEFSCVVAQRNLKDL
jgi:hypothetical protein